MTRRALLVAICSTLLVSSSGLAQAAAPGEQAAQVMPKQGQAARAPALTIIDRLPLTTRYVVAGRGLDGLIKAIGATPIGLVASQQGVIAQAGTALKAIGDRAGWTGQQTIERLLSGQAMLVVFHPEKPGGNARWALVMEVGKSHVAHLRAKLDMQPGEVVSGVAVMSIERGQYAMVTRANTNALAQNDRQWVMICPRQGSVADLIVPALVETTPLGLGAVPTVRELGPMTDGTLMVMADWSDKPSAWTNCVVAGAKLADGGFDLNMVIREPGMDKVRSQALGQSQVGLTGESVLIGLAERRIAGDVPASLRAMSLLGPLDPLERAEAAPGSRWVMFQQVAGKLRIDARVWGKLDASAFDRAMLNLAGQLENQPAEAIDLPAGVPRTTELTPAQGTLLRAIMGDRLELNWSSQDGDAQASLFTPGNRVTLVPGLVTSELSWLNAGQVRPRALLAAIPADMRERVAIIGVRSMLESIDAIRWRMWLDGQGDATVIRGRGELRWAAPSAK